MSLPSRILLFVATIGGLLSVYWFLQGTLLPTSEVEIVAFSALVMLGLVALFVEPFFTRPTDVVASTTGILLVLSPMHTELSRLGAWYWAFWWYCFFLLLVALAALVIGEPRESPASQRNKWSVRLRDVAVNFGNGRWLFFVLALLTLAFYVDSQEPRFLVLVAIGVLAAVNYGRNLWGAFTKEGREPADAIGEVIGVDSRNIVLARIFRNAGVVRPRDIVEFRLGADEPKTPTRGLVAEVFVLDDERRVRVLVSDALTAELAEEPFLALAEPNVLYLLGLAPESLSTVRRFVGTITEGSSIAAARFVCAGSAGVHEGDVVESSVDGQVVLYQLVEGKTQREQLERSNRGGMIVATAVQLGKWIPIEYKFERFGWLPEIATPVFVHEVSDIADPTLEERQAVLGYMPGSSYPVIADLEAAVSHHLAILGVTGAGKSVFCRDLVRRIIESGTRVIAVDFTDEYAVKLADQEIRPVVEEDSEDNIFQAIDDLADELNKWPRDREQERIDEFQGRISEGFEGGLRSFLDGDRGLALFGLPDVANTTAILEYTRQFFRALFELARSGEIQEPLCVVIEEAHTVVPEWNAMGSEEKKSREVVNAISQIALQGRKYGIGFVIVAQRTANVSKTVLTQCNSIVAFQQFDQTSSDFLAYHLGPEMARALPSLRPRHAVAAGKGFLSSVPVIFRVPDITEPSGEPGQSAPVESREAGPRHMRVAPMPIAPAEGDSDPRRGSNP